MWSASKDKGYNTEEVFLDPSTESMLAGVAIE